MIDALATLAFDYPRRAAFFRGELKEFLLLARDQGFSPLDAEGLVRRRDGRAAVHAGQLPPLRGRLRRRRPRRPVAAATPDVIGSVANYLARHDWQPGQPVLAARRGCARGAGCGVAAARRRHQRAAPACGVAGRRRRPSRSRRPRCRPTVGLLLLEEGSDGEREPVDRLPQLLRDHALQQEPAVRGRRVGACRAAALGALDPTGATSTHGRSRPCRCARTRACSAGCWASRARGNGETATRASKRSARPRSASGAPRRTRRRAIRTELSALLNELSIAQTLDVVRAFSYFSHLANIAEDVHQNRRRRAHALAGSPPQRGSLAARVRSPRGARRRRATRSPPGSPTRWSVAGADRASDRSPAQEHPRLPSARSRGC